MSTPLPPGPLRVQIQTKAGCNGRCVFCPNEALIEKGLEQGEMSVELFRKIVDDLAQTPPRRIGLYLMNEPLLDRRLPDFVRYVTERVPGAKTQVITNGTFLSEEFGEALIDAGVKQVKVSLQSLDPEKNERIMGYTGERVIANCIAFRKLLDRKRASQVDFRISMVVTSINADEIDDARRFWQEHDIRLVTSALENRGGNIQAARDLNPHEMRSMGDCIRPSRDLMVLFSGDVPLCCVDWFRTVILGNLGRQSVQEVWHGEKFQAIRAALREGRADALPQICVNCSESAKPNYHRRGLKGILSRVFGKG